MSFGQFASTTQFYLFGRKNCTRTGWEAHRKEYEMPDILDDPNLSLKDKVFLVTGANAGVGKEITSYLAGRQAIVYMVCRNPDRAQAARDEIVQNTNNDNIFIILADCGFEKHIRRVWDEFISSETQRLSRAGASTGTKVKLALHGLVCNAGALLHSRTLTSEEVEVTFATHLLFGVYLLGELALPLLDSTPDARLVVVSSGGMYNTKFPDWAIATSTSNQPYDGQFAYAYAKRGQVLLCERWAASHPQVKVVSCHPGWTQTEAVDQAYGEQKKYLEPLRTPWEGAEGIIWLLVAPRDKIRTGEFYLDRSPQVKHMAGPFFTEGSFTKNTEQEVDLMMENLAKWSQGQRPTEAQVQEQLALERPLEAGTHFQVDLNRYCGKWYVLAAIPSFVEAGACNCIENYTLNSTDNTIRTDFEYIPKGSTKATTMKMKNTMHNAPFNTHWKVSPKVLFYLPVALDYLLLDVAPDYSFAIISVPDRSMLWFLIREKPLISSYNLGRIDTNDKELNEIVQRQEELYNKAVQFVSKKGFDISKIEKFPWNFDLESNN